MVGSRRGQRARVVKTRLLLVLNCNGHRIVKTVVVVNVGMMSMRMSMSLGLGLGLCLLLRNMSKVHCQGVVVTSIQYGGGRLLRREACISTMTVAFMIMVRAV